MASFNDTSIAITRELSKEEKKKDGIYFTPKSIVRKMLDVIGTIPNGATILEPSCGSGEFLDELPAGIDAIEYNKKIYDKIANRNANIMNKDFLTHDGNYDIIVGNPPYYVLPKKDVSSEYHQYFTGRPNIFILFIVKALKMLNNSGILGFVLPKSILNSLYYEGTRKWINRDFRIMGILPCDDEYIDTKQQTIILIIKKCEPCNDAFAMEINGYTIFGDTALLRKFYNGASTLADLGCQVSVGSIVWNQCKAELTDNTTGTRLIYSTDIVNNTLSMKKYSNPSKKNYIMRKGRTDSMIVVNRGYGTGKYNFSYCVIKNIGEYLVENHLICITGNNQEKIIKSFNMSKTKAFIDLYFGNNAINTTELKYILPIYLFFIHIMIITYQCVKFAILIKMVIYIK